MRVLALDQQTRITGWALFVNGRYVRSGVINHSQTRKYTSDERFKVMVKDIWHVIDECRPDVVVMEDVQQQNNPAGLKLLAELRGCIMGYCLEYEYGYDSMHVQTWRSKLGFDFGRQIKRNYLKIQAVEYVNEHFKKQVQDDEADAICIGAAYSKVLEEQEET